MSKIQNYNNKLEIVEQAKAFNAKGYNFIQIAKVLNIDYRTVKKYIAPNFVLKNSRNRISNLKFYDAIITSNINKGITVASIFRILVKKGYTGSYSNLKSYCRRFKDNNYNPDKIVTKNKIEIKNVIKFLYHPIEEIKEISLKIFDNIFKEYPIIETIYTVIKEFKSALFITKNSSHFIEWLTKVKDLHISELDSFVIGLERDLPAVINAINEKYSNGLAEGTVNKIKFIKRIMYGRCKFDTLRNKILIAEKYN